MISYVYLCAHPCGPDSFRPNDAKSHLCRRDALCRIAAQSLYAAPELAHPACDDCIFLFNDGKEGSKSPAVIAMTSKLVGAVPVPTERTLLQVWRDAARAATKTGVRGKSISTNLTDACICSLEPHREAALLSNSSASSSSSSSSSSAGRKRPAPTPSAGTTGGLDKRMLLKTLQQQCPLEFLRKHGLNCSEDVAMKKRKRAEVQAAHDEWKHGGGGSGEAAAATAAAAVQFTSAEPFVPGSELDDTFKVVLQRAVHRARGGRTVVLLLHEDFQHELAVFGGKAGLAECATEAGVDRVVCVLGAVRDMEGTEERALMRAAAALGIVCVGANLGRVAEFTSKIAAAFNTHGLAAAGQALSTSRLARAVEALPPVVAGKMGKLAPQRKKTNDTAAAAATADTTGSLHLHVCFWTNVAATDLQKALDDNASSSRLVVSAVVQVVVNTLWRSKLVGEVTSGDVEAGDTTAPTHMLTPHLTLVFTCGSRIQVGQRALAVNMGERHQAAPSEAQILQALLELHKAQAGTAGSWGETGLVSVLQDNLPAGLRSKQRKRLKVLDLAQLVLPTRGIKMAADAASGVGGARNGTFDLAAAAYEEACTCSSSSSSSSNSNSNSNSKCEGGEAGGGDRHVLVVCRRGGLLGTDDGAAVDALIGAWSDDNDDDKKKAGTSTSRRFYVRGSVCGALGVAPHTAVTICQHFAYHGRLLPALRKGTKAL